MHRMDVEIPVLAGYLNVPTQTGFSLNRISKKVWKIAVFPPFYINISPFIRV